jgi:heme-degrading monooxygenase HmoA
LLEGASVTIKGFALACLLLFLLRKNKSTRLFLIVSLWETKEGASSMRLSAAHRKRKKA